MNPHDELAKRLRADVGDPPPFSPLLHQRIMSTLRTGGLTESAPTAPHRPFTWRIAAGLAVAAAFAIAAWIAMNPSPTPQYPVPEIAQAMPALTPSRMVEPVNALLGENTARRLDEGKYGYLDQDAQRLALFVADQIPTLASAKK